MKGCIADIENPKEANKDYGSPNHVDLLDRNTMSVAQALSEHFDGKVNG